jgi:hypothetical protein
MMRLIDADEASARIDAKLNEIPTFTESEYGIMGYRNACVAFKRMLDSLPTASEWIPVSEDLPIDCILVLVTYLDEDVNFPIVDIGYHTSRGFCDRDFNVIEVLAWMELPKPYEVEEE